MLLFDAIFPRLNVSHVSASSATLVIFKDSNVRNGAMQVPLVETKAPRAERIPAFRLSIYKSCV
jgi:hypothetical protein